MARLGPTIEAQLMPNLQGFSGLFIRGYLPQVWVFEVETESASLIVDSNGNVEASRGAVQPTDVLITTTHDFLSSALEAAIGLRSRESVAARSFNPHCYTPKGRAAFDFLRSRIGL